MSKNPNSAASPKRTTQILMGAAGLVLVAGGGVAFLMNAQIGRMQQTISAKESEVGSSEQVAERYQQTLVTYNATAAKTHYLESSVSAKSFVPTLLKQLQGLAAQTHLAVTSVRPGILTSPTSATPAAPAGTAAPADSTVKKKVAPYDTLDIAVDIKGTYANTVTFLYGLTQFPKIVSVSSAQMQPAPPDAANPSASPVITTNLHLTAFVFHENKTSAPTTLAAAVVPSVSTSAVSQAADHAASRAVGASKV
ncbi:MAG: hypothetical protein M3Y28_07325, partial [Armatimonadota bacterium]|nr:hypothetical protein [Armatimonadota bacterium]